MKLNTQGRYALIALVDLSSRNTKKNVSLSEISERQNISLPYLEQLFLKLRKAGIVKSYRGSYGGYAIAKSPELTIKILLLLYIGAPRKGESNLFFHFIEPAKLIEKNSPKPVATYKLFLSIAIPPE